MTERHGDWMQTASGVQFWPLDPRPSEVRPGDIAHALAHICRYNGHTRNFYSVAEHSVLVSQVVPPEHALWGLMHDAAEAYLGDVIRPLKRYVAQYEAREEKVMRAIADYFDLGPEPKDIIKQADNAVLAAEGPVVFRDDLTKRWGPLPPPANVRIQFLSPTEARAAFMQRLRELLERKVHRSPRNG